MSIEFLKKHAQTLAGFARESSAQAAQNPADFWLQATARNQKQAATDAAQDLQLACAAQVGELLDLRFIGPQADGAISLEAFIRIAEPLLKAWKAAAYRIRHGAVDGRIGGEIADTLNLKLAGLSRGSARISLTGNAAADLSGESLLHATLTQTFNLLAANNDAFYDAVDAMGGRAAAHFGDAMKAIKAAGLSAEFSWQSPTQCFTWQGSTDEIVRLKVLLDAVAEPETYDEKISGLVSGITDTGRLEIRTQQGKVQVRFPLDQTEAVLRLAIRKSATLLVRTTKYWNAVTKKDVLKRQMIGLADS
ncbi:hypothetical protein RugamoR57_33080 [Duganella caerulea]|uniref:hypothetical protein n=1 Tax=Duganella caerulea TaxID=2885762 RepID=UPI0030E78296